MKIYITHFLFAVSWQFFNDPQVVELRNLMP